MKTLGDNSLSNVKKFLILMLVFSPSIALADDEPTVQPVNDKVITLTEPKQLDIATMLAVVMPESVKKEAPKPVAPKPPEPVMHEVQDGDTLTSIGEAHQLPWTRVYDANTEVDDPNFIKPGEKLRIPRADEDIAARPIPENAPPVPEPVQPVAQTAAVYKVPVHYEPSTPELIGSYGWVAAGGNCVNTAKNYGKNQPGNPINWVPTTQTPFIGAAALFYFNHVAIVTGIHSDGSIEVTHENCPGCPTRYPRSQIRGFF